MAQYQGWIGRRAALKGLGISGALWVSEMMGVTGQQRFALAAAPDTAIATTKTIKADSALQRLMEGNQRFISQKRTYPHQSLERLQELAHDQKPFAVILGCADSRVPVEMLFDAGVGDIFDIRVAGNIVTPEVLGSLEYAVAMLDTRLIMVLGHERCGAVTAAIKHTVVPGSIGTLIAAIEPAIPTGEAFSEDLVQQAVIANVKYQMEAIRRNSELVVERVLKNQLQIVGGRYDLDTGAVTLV
jgi:carbonic anhydrase